MREELALNCIHLWERLDRYENIIRQQKEQGFYLRLHEGIVNRTDRKMGICQSHKNIVKEAKENRQKMVAICEDDIVFFAPKAWEYFLENIPQSFDTFHGMIYVGDIIADRIVSLFSAMTLYIVHERFYDFFLSLPDSCHIDRELGLTANIHEYKIIDKFVCYQDGSKSDNNFMTCDYSPYLEGRKIYGKG